MRRSSPRTWLILALILGAAAPSPKMASYLLAGSPSAAAGQGARKEPSCRARNRIGTPSGLARAEIRVCPVAAASARGRRTSHLAFRPDPPTAPLGPARATPPVPFRLRC